MVPFIPNKNILIPGKLYNPAIDNLALFQEFEAIIVSKKEVLLFVEQTQWPWPDKAIAHALKFLVNDGTYLYPVRKYSLDCSGPYPFKLCKRGLWA